jgi:hypothetical protein
MPDDREQTPGTRHQANSHAKADTLRERPRRLRAGICRGLAKSGDGPPIVRDGGQFEAGLIRGVSLCTRGEALGHYVWLDKEFIASVSDTGRSAAKGIKARFTHPSLSGDGLGTFLGRFLNHRLSDDGNQAIADLHFSQAAHKTPDGDLAEYVMDLAEADPEAFGTSIVYEFDRQAEQEFKAEHTVRVDDPETKSSAWIFQSPDPDNLQHLPHARLAVLCACDCVDEPAANPAGLFHREQQFAQEADAMMAYAVGLSPTAPATAALTSGVHPDRVKAFVSRFLDAHNLTLVSKETSMTDASDTTAAAGSPEEAKPATEETTPNESGTETNSPEEEKPDVEEPVAGSQDEAKPVVEEPVAGSPEEAKPDGQTKSQSATDAGRAECKRFIAAFGQQGGVWYAEGLSFEDAQVKHASELKAENESLKKRLAAAGDAAGEAEPLAFQPAKGSQAAKAAGLAGKLGENLGRMAAGIKIRGKGE